MAVRRGFSRPVWIFLIAALTVAAAALGYLIVRAATVHNPEEQRKVDAARRKKEVYAREGLIAKQMFERMGKPRSGEWLDHFIEAGQTAEEFANGWHNKKTGKRHTIYLLPLEPLTDLQKKCLPVMARYGKAFFDCETKLLPAHSMPKSAHNPKRGQYDAANVLAWLKSRVPEDALVYTAVTGADLYHGNLNFVFGVGSLAERVGLYSVHRYGTDYPVLLRRALKVMNHEVGHIFSLPHCIFYKCSVNGSNSLTESDGRPIHYCPVCLAKLQKALGFDPPKRFAALAAFYRSVGFSEDAVFVEKRSALVKAAASQGR